MITIFDKFARSFTGIGKNILYPESCTIQEELNGMFELTLFHAYDTAGRWQGLQLQNIIYAPTPRGNQPFRIYRTSLGLDGITVYARHIFYDLLDNMVLKYEVNFANPQEWLDIYKEALVLDQGFTFTAVGDENNFTGSGFVNEFMSGVAALIEPYHPENIIQWENRSFISWFPDMMLIRDGFDVIFQKESEEKTGFCVKYGRNMMGLTVEEDISDIITRVYPRVDNEEAPPYSKEYVDSVHVEDYVYPKVASVTYETPTDITPEFLELYYETVVNTITFDFDQKATRKVNINVNFQMLSRLAGYEKYKPLEKVLLGDIITILDERTNVKRDARVISYEWDAVAEKYNNIELGTAQESLVSFIKGGSYKPSHYT